MSLSSERLLRLVSSGDETAALDAYNRYMSSHCYLPKRIRVRDAHTCRYRFIQVPCGSCYHCRETKVNEWVTRMYAHCEDYKHVYFITLTYSSFYRRNSDVTNLLLKKLNQAVWHYDNYNSLHKHCWRPCLLVKDHYQNFMKRLRKNTNNDSLTYVLSGEYGKKYGSPHFHAILFSKIPISYDDVKRAWSVSLFRYNSGKWTFKTNQVRDGVPYNFLIGRVDFNDLVQNGTFNTEALIKVDNNFMSASNCFAYVCKYVCKQDNSNHSRIDLAYRSLWRKDQFVNIYNKEILRSKAEDYLLNIGYSKPDSNYQRNYFNLLNRLSYEKQIFYFSDKILSDGLCRFKVFSLYGHECSKDLFPPAYGDFLQFYSPFVEFSRSTPIGSLYAKAHLYEFVEGVFSRPLLQTKGFVVPRYFARKADQHVYGFRLIHKTIKSSSLCLGDLPFMRGCFEKACSSGSLDFMRLRSDFSFENLSSYLRNSDRVLVEVSTRERIVQEKFPSDRLLKFKYDRSAHSYHLSGVVHVSDFIRNFLDSLSSEYNRYYVRLNNARSRLRDEDSSFCILNEFADINTLRRDFIQNQDLYLRNKQFDYDLLHDSCE